MNDFERVILYVMWFFFCAGFGGIAGTLLANWQMERRQKHMTETMSKLFQGAKKEEWFGVN